LVLVDLECAGMPYRKPKHTSSSTSGKSGMRRQPPELPAYRHPDGVHLLAWCAHCCHYHWHGHPAGHRCAHCADRESPYDRIGYVLIDAGPASPDLLRDARRKRPRGPAWQELRP
jgi:hypothetical protein